MFKQPSWFETLDLKLYPLMDDQIVSGCFSYAPYIGTVYNILSHLP